VTKLTEPRLFTLVTVTCLCCLWIATPGAGPAASAATTWRAGATPARTGIAQSASASGHGLVLRTIRAARKRGGELYAVSALSPQTSGRWARTPGLRKPSSSTTTARSGRS
jgi:hypothetical protein